MLNLFALFLVLGTTQDSDTSMVWVEGNGEIQSFYMDKYEVTMAEFQRFVAATGYKTSTEILDSGKVYNPYYRKVKGVNWRHDVYGREIPQERYNELPVSRVSLKDAQAYAQWVGKRIPTKEEWMYAAHGGIKSKSYRYVGGNRARQVGWFDGNSRETLMPIGQKTPNELGIYDLGGNIEEVATDFTDKKIWSMGGSFFTDKDYFELDYLENGSYRHIGGATMSEGPLTGIRLVKDAK